MNCLPVWNTGHKLHATQTHTDTAVTQFPRRERESGAVWMSRQLKAMCAELGVPEVHLERLYRRMAPLFEPGMRSELPPVFLPHAHKAHERTRARPSSSRGMKRAHVVSLTTFFHREFRHSGLEGVMAIIMSGMNDMELPELGTRSERDVANYEMDFTRFVITASRFCMLDDHTFLLCFLRLFLVRQDRQECRPLRTAESVDPFIHRYEFHKLVPLLNPDPPTWMLYIDDELPWARCDGFMPLSQLAMYFYVYPSLAWSVNKAHRAFRHKVLGEAFWAARVNNHKDTLTMAPSQQLSSALEASYHALRSERDAEALTITRLLRSVYFNMDLEAVVLPTSNEVDTEVLQLQLRDRYGYRDAEMLMRVLHGEEPNKKMSTTDHNEHRSTPEVDHNFKMLSTSKLLTGGCPIDEKEVLMDGWRQMRDTERGADFYHNVYTGEARWDAPRGAVTLKWGKGLAWRVTDSRPYSKLPVYRLVSAIDVVKHQYGRVGILTEAATASVIPLLPPVELNDR